jgi:competence protein ComEC
MPVYFLPANILAVPLSSLALIGTLLLWVSATAGISLPLIGHLTGYLIQSMNQGIQQISRLPGALISEINWTDGQVLLAYLLIIALSSWIQFRKSGSFLLAMLFLTGFFILDLHQNWKQERQELLLVHHLPGKSILTIVNGKTGSCYLNRYSPGQHRALEDSKRIFGIQQLHYSPASLVRFRNETLAIPGSNADLEQQLIFNPDYLLISRQVSSIQPLLTSEPGKTLVLLDGSLSENRAIEWYRELTDAGYQVHSTWRDGAYCKEFSGKPTNRRPEK